MAETGSGRDPRGSGGFTVHIADELEVYFNEVAHGRPVGTGHRRGIGHES